MAEKKEKASAAAEPKAKAVKKAAAPKSEAPKAPAKAVPAAAKREAVPAPKQEKQATPPAASGKTITLIQTGSPIGREGYQRATLIGLGLNKIRRTRTVPDTPAVRGMIERVKHLVKVVK